MTLLPIITRELRSEARRPWNYWLRLLAGTAVTCVFTFSMLVSGLSIASNGGMLFGLVSLVLYYGIWLLGPLLTADCLSREKRLALSPELVTGWGQSFQYLSTVVAMQKCSFLCVKFGVSLRRRIE